MFNIGDDVKLYAALTDADDAYTDPTAMVLIVKRPDDAYVSYKTASGWTDQSDWNAATNTPSLADGTGTGGHYYTVTAAGSVDFGNGSITFAVGDQVFYNGTAWRKIPAIVSSTALTKEDTGRYYVYQFIGLAGDWYLSGECVGTRAGDSEHFGVRTPET
jgi:hypothetical protein